ncbi:MAG: DNA cytosine methyltransferase [Phenylobacterium sp.]|uniref:DNA cytosine methyltransferase n=1 Tax=Phenylobacterium sp. TaxID=1871053 RepID=UPI00273681F7|nr:DNA cytosine methyltransferase [Phenylobacterium sp.]MDP3749284.1 DNA cytosine methyltransferase [Phenylobacterium sp.]
MRAIDLYSGIGGWSLGLRLAGVEVVASYEWWQPAIDTHNGNHGGTLAPVDIRKLALSDLPSGIDLVVGSPPCTEFSYANRGGSGDISEGLKDLVKFLEVVDHLKPRWWALENVPRVADVLEQGLADPKHGLYRFRHLAPLIEVVDFSEFGAPQARRRCIAGNIPLELVRAFQPKLGKPTLGGVVAALAAKDVVIDPVWGASLAANQLTEMEAEAALNGEELRMNREAKAYHPVYNNMAFPDPMDEPARTVTATCTRVSRESIVIADPRVAGAFRRLTIRERGCLQGFPITYQFYGRSFAEKAKMIGNAIPPTFTHLLALAAQGVSPDVFQGLEQAKGQLELPAAAAPVTLPDREGRTYPVKRSFRAALPGLRFKSGMRFELSNAFDEDAAGWNLRFFFGSSKDVREVEFDGAIWDEFKETPVGAALRALSGAFREAAAELGRTDPMRLQRVWNHRTDGVGPFEVVDLLGGLAEKVHDRLLAEGGATIVADAQRYVVVVADEVAGDGKLPNKGKLERNALRVLSGFLVADWFNGLAWHDEARAAA